MPDFEEEKLKNFMGKHFSEISKSSPLHLLSFFKYLYQQFKPLAESSLLRNEGPKTSKKKLQWKHIITKSVIDMAKLLCKCQYDDVELSSDEKNMRVESTGHEEFYLCKKWHSSNDACFLVNQDGGWIAQTNSQNE
ncbi:hypothetical protein RFI_28786 [Reticulomyxa filosa]|uniref:Uncharacterized protein n=1 Tax=Reticulomyxa filosa TaxID=46433 RepID=X6M4M5_RETFI|nr:hypothetical protein RFI_28786 [Reticulomyxa filosa]|eukprot:ETO08601.1 hypothetical protein RFI_28786 [Reticulomyxa filosa]